MKEDDFANVINILNVFCKSYGGNILDNKSTILSWNNSPLDWLKGDNWQWGGPSTIVKYLGIPFFVDPSLMGMDV